jgi:A/G-specific adenine glycosylase
MINKNRAVAKILLKWHRKNRRIFPWREKRDSYLVLVAEFFLQRTPANRVAALLPKFIEEFPSPDKLARANPSHLEHIYGSLGLKKRMRWLVESMKIVHQKYGGRIPNKIEDLLLLPGIGEYTASAILCFGFGQSISIVDANVVRVLTRIFGLLETHKAPSVAIKKIAREMLPKTQIVDYNEAILDFAALICKKHPLCDQCPMNGLCDYYRSNFL